MPKRDVVRGYAQGIFEIALAEGDLEQVEDELYRFAKTLEREGPLREALLDPTLPNERKRARDRRTCSARRPAGTRSRCSAS